MTETDEKGNNAMQNLIFVVENEMKNIRAMKHNNYEISKNCYFLRLF